MHRNTINNSLNQISDREYQFNLAMNDVAQMDIEELAKKLQEDIPLIPDRKMNMGATEQNKKNWKQSQITQFKFKFSEIDIPMRTS